MQLSQNEQLIDEITKVHLTFSTYPSADAMPGPTFDTLRYVVCFPVRFQTGDLDMHLKTVRNPVHVRRDLQTEHCIVQNL